MRRIPGPALDLEDVTYLAAASGGLALRDVSGIEWSEMTAQQIQTNGMLGGSLDIQSIQTYRRVPDGQDRSDFRQLVRSIMSGYRIDTDEARRAKTHALLSLPKMHLRELNGSACTRTRRKHLRMQLSGAVVHQSAAVFEQRHVDRLLHKRTPVNVHSSNTMLQSFRFASLP